MWDGSATVIVVEINLSERLRTTKRWVYRDTITASLAGSVYSQFRFGQDFSIF